MSPLELLWGVPEHVVIEERVGTSDGVYGPWRVSILLLSIRSLNLNLVFLEMLNSWSTVSVGLDGDVEGAELIFIASELVSVPSVKVSKNRKSLGSWGPLVVLNVTVWFDVESILLV